MANRLPMATVEAILALHRQGHSNRKIARLLGVNRETVGKHVRASQSKPAKAPTGSEAEAGSSKPAKAPTGSEFDQEDSATRRSDCQPYRQQILAKLELGLSAQRIYQDLRDEEEGFDASYWSVRRFVARLGRTSTPPFRRLECDPGEEAQVDFGTAAVIRTPDGKTRRPWVLRVVLSYSRKAYSEVVYRQTTDAFIGCLENAFAHFGGVPQRLVIDNLKAAVTRADWYDPELNPKLRSFAEHYGTTILPTRPYTPRHKGKVENGIKYVKDNALKGREFESLEAENQFLREWEAKVADTRIHGTTKKQVEQLFVNDERNALLPLPRERFAFFHEAQRTVHRDGHLEVDKAFYSAPPEYVGRRLWVRWDARLVRIYNDRFELLATHAKAEPGRFRTSEHHIPKEKVSAVERGTDHLLRQVSAIGPHSAQWSEAMTQARGVEAVRVLLGLRSLAGKYSTQEMEDACRTALAYGAYQLQTVRQLLARRAPAQQQFDFLDEHPIIRPLSDYSLESLHQFRKERSP